MVLVEGRYMYMLHDLKTLHLDPAAGKFAAVLSGTRMCRISTQEGRAVFQSGFVRAAAV